MSLDTCPPDLSQPSFTEPGFRPGLSQQRLARLAPRPASGLRSPVKCCADATLMRGEPVAASALHCRRFLLLEVPGPWGWSALDESHMEADVARRLAAAADANDARVVLIRRRAVTPPRTTSRGTWPGPWPTRHRGTRASCGVTGSVPRCALAWPGRGRAAADLWEAEVVHRAGDGGPEIGPEAGRAGSTAS